MKSLFQVLFLGRKGGMGRETSGMPKSQQQRRHDGKLNAEGKEHHQAPLKDSRAMTITCLGYTSKYF